jgi:hypothetical protein
MVALLKAEEAWGEGVSRAQMEEAWQRVKRQPA